MLYSKLSVLLILFCVFQTPPALAIKKSYIVYLGKHSHGTGLLTSDDLQRVADSHYQLLAPFLGSKEKAKDSIFYSYKRHINGFAATLEEDVAAKIAKHPDVLSVFPNHGRKLHTTHSWDFLMLAKNGTVHLNSAWKKARFGEDTIIGNLDTGVWPEDASFSGKGFGPIPSKWKGSCHDDTVHCNRKLIGARYFNKGYSRAIGQHNSSMDTARDHDGHGSHTLSTAGGNFVPGASVFGLGNGTAKGGSPRARVAAYKVCYPPVGGSECFDSDIMEAFDNAIHDGVDVLSVSLGGDPSDYLEDGIAIASLHAVQKGIVVVCSAGNSGPFDGTVSNVAPWLFTVGASTMDRDFATYVELQNRLRLKGTSMSKSLPEDKLYPLISAAQANAANASAADSILCKEGTLDPKKVKGKILVCLRGDNARVDKGVQASRAGAVGMILCNDKLSGNEIIADAHFLPTSHLTYTDGEAVFSYVDSTKDPVGFISAPTAEFPIKPAPFMASFSSKGPNLITPGVLKPDITAPGVNVIAAYTQAKSPTGEDFDKRRTPFNAESGTSMSCPHVSGVVGLLKTLHPTWSPAAIKSAIMTSARTRDNRGRPILDGSFAKATPLNYGAGHIRPNRAVDPGLVYDLSFNDYLRFLCAIGYNETTIRPFAQEDSYKCPKHATLLNFNYPSITLAQFNGSATVIRKLTNVGSPGTYKASVRLPAGISASVHPNTLKFKRAGEKHRYKLTITATKAALGRIVSQGYVFGKLTWSDGNHNVRSPITISAGGSAA